jgi:GMP synthase (glutamine-hydrolysing)
MKPTVLCIVHQETSETGRVGRQLQEMGYQVDVRCPRHGDALPDVGDGLAGGVVFGGPTSAMDRDVDAGIKAELDWIERAVAAELPFLGICLGAQMLARVLGARVYYHPYELFEIGYVPIHPTPAWRECLPATQHFYEWHKEGFDLPRGAVLLAEGERYPNQAFRYGPNAYGIQFHPKVTREIMLRWIHNSGERLNRPEVPCREEQCRQVERYDSSVEGWAYGFLDDWIGLPRGEG